MFTAEIPGSVSGAGSEGAERKRGTECGETRLLLITFDFFSSEEEMFWGTL